MKRRPLNARNMSQLWVHAESGARFAAELRSAAKDDDAAKLLDLASAHMAVAMSQIEHASEILFGAAPVQAHINHMQKVRLTK